MTLKHLSNLSVVTAEKAHQLTALTEKLLYTEVGSRVATERFKISVPISSSLESLVTLIEYLWLPLIPL